MNIPNQIKTFLLFNLSERFNQCQLPGDLYVCIYAEYRRLLFKEIREEINLLKSNKKYIALSKCMSPQAQKYVLKHYVLHNNPDIENLSFYELQKRAVVYPPYAIQYIHNPSEEIQRIAVQQSGWAIQYIHNPSEEIQKLAVQQDGHIIQYIHNPSEEIQKLAVQQNGFAIQYIHNPSEEIQMIAIQNGYVIECIHNPSRKIQRIARLYIDSHDPTIPI